MRILFHVDLVKLGTMVQEVKKYEKELLEIYHIIGFLDSMLAVASYREMLEGYTLPVFQAGGSVGNIQRMEIKGLYHPLVLSMRCLPRQSILCSQRLIRHVFSVSILLWR